jgi:hypothetical protein
MGVSDYIAGVYLRLCRCSSWASTRSRRARINVLVATAMNIRKSLGQPFSANREGSEKLVRIAGPATSARQVRSLAVECQKPEVARHIKYEPPVSVESLVVRKLLPGHTANDVSRRSVKNKLFRGSGIYHCPKKNKRLLVAGLLRYGRDGRNSPDLI